MFLCVFYKHIFQSIDGLAVCFLEGMGIDVHGGRCLGMTKAAGYCPDILLTCDQQCGRSMPEAVEGDCWELRSRLLVCVIPGDGILECGVGGGVRHLLSVLLDEQPLGTLPVVTDGQSVLAQCENTGCLTTSGVVHLKEKLEPP